MTTPRRLLLASALLPLAAAAGCSTPCPPATERVVVEVRPVPVVPAVPAAAPAAPAANLPQIPPAGTTYVRDDPAAEAARRAWLEEHYGRRSEPRYVPAREVEPVRVIVEHDEPSWRYYVPPVSLSLGWWGGSGHCRDGWGWGVGWNTPLFWW